MRAAQWDEDLGRSLGGKAEDYAEAIAVLPAATTLTAQQSFMAQWGEKDPEAAARWLGSLPESFLKDRAAGAIAEGAPAERKAEADAVLESLSEFQRLWAR